MTCKIVESSLPKVANDSWLMSRADCTPYLLQLGLTKSKTSLVWIAGPLSGLVMQPVVGVLADSSKSKWGRRRPFMIGGSLIVGICLIVLGWTSEIVGMFVTEAGSVSRCVSSVQSAPLIVVHRSGHAPLLWPFLVSMLSTLQSMQASVTEAKTL